MFKDTKSHGLVSVQFLSALHLFFGGDVELSKDTITELYKNLSLRVLRAEQQIDFDKIFDLTGHRNFKVKRSILANIDDQNEAIRTSNKNIKGRYEFTKKTSNEDSFEDQIVENILKYEPYEHKKVETPYVAPTVVDATTIEGQVNKEIDDFLQLASEFYKVDAAATKQKK